VLIRSWPKPGISTHKSRGIDNMAALRVIGSIETSIIESVRGKPRPEAQSR
jgi:hypothetical protein